MSVEESTVSRKSSLSNEHTSESSSSSATTAKLVPAAPPAVNAWGSVPIASTASFKTKSEPNGHKEKQLADAESVTIDASVPSTPALISVTKPKQNSVSSKAKTSGKEKWVPFEAEIRISTNSTSRKKSKNSSQTNDKKKSNSNNGSNNNGNNKGQKNKSNNNQQKKKDSPNPSTNGHKQDNNRLHNKKKEPIEVLSSESGSLKSKSSAQESNSQKNTGELDNGTLEKSDPLKTFNDDLAKVPMKSHDRSRYHRNSEPNLGNNNNNSDRSNHARRHSNKPFTHDNYRNSISGVISYSNTPYLVNNGFNYGYTSPFLNSYPSPQYLYNSNAQAPYRPKSSRSSSHSPARNDYNTPIIFPNPIVPSASPNFPPPASLNPVSYPYVQDPMSLVVKQLNYYFSEENLAKDFYLRKQMDSNGLVPLKKLIEFKRLNKLTGGDITMLYSALSYTSFLEPIQDKVRVRDNWEMWILPSEQRDLAGRDIDEEDTK